MAFLPGSVAAGHDPATAPVGPLDVRAEQQLAEPARPAPQGRRPAAVAASSDGREYSRYALSQGDAIGLQSRSVTIATAPVRTRGLAATGIRPRKAPSRLVPLDTSPTGNPQSSVDPTINSTRGSSQGATGARFTQDARFLDTGVSPALESLRWSVSTGQNPGRPSGRVTGRLRSDTHSDTHERQFIDHMAKI